MRILVNGEVREVEADATVGQIVADGGYRIELIAVELDGQIVRKAEYDKTPLAEGAKLEIVSFVGGG